MSNDPDNEERVVVLRAVLKEVISLNRELEPWVEDVIVDNIVHYHQHVQEEIRALTTMTDMANVRLQLRVLDTVYRQPASSPPDGEMWFTVKLRADTYPDLVLKMFSNSRVTDTVTPRAMEELCTLAERCTINRNVNIVRASVSFLSRMETDILVKLEIPREVLIDVIALILSNGDEDKAAKVYRQTFPESLPYSAKLAHLDSQLYFSSRHHSSAFTPNFSQTSRYWRAFHRAVIRGAADLSTKRSVVRSVIEARNTIILGEIMKTIAEESANGTEIESLTEFLRHEIQSSGIIRDILDVIFSETSAFHEFRSSVETILRLEGHVITASRDLCYHYVRCDVVCVGCLADSLCTLIRESDVTRLSHLYQILHLLLVIAPCTTCGSVDGSTSTCGSVDGSTSTCGMNELKLEAFLVSQLCHPVVERRDACLDGIISKLDRDLLPRDIIERVLEMSYSDSHYHVREGAYLVLAALPCSVLEDHLGEIAVMLERQLRSIQYEDSSLGIAFFKFLRNVKSLVAKFIVTHISSLASEGDGASPKQSENKFKHGQSDQKGLLPENEKLDINAIIDDICDARDCRDVEVIKGYHDNESPVSPPQVLISLIEVITADRCDVERFCLGIILMGEIITTIGNKDAADTLIRYINEKTDFYVRIREADSPYLTKSVESISSILTSRGYDYVNFPQKEKVDSGLENLEMVLALVRATPDPNIVMDCY